MISGRIVLLYVVFLAPTVIVGITVSDQHPFLFAVIGSIVLLGVLYSINVRSKNHLDRVTPQFHELRNDAVAYIGDPTTTQQADAVYSQYLTRHDHDRFRHRVRALRSEFEANHIPGFMLTGKPRRQHVQIDRWLEVLDQWLSHKSRYNKGFVERELERTEDLFTNIGPQNITLDDEQRRAVVRNDTYNQVIAGAGTGKTIVLVTRIAYLVTQQNIHPERILVVTYTNKASQEMETRLAEYFGITDVTVSTLHAFGLDTITDSRAHRHVADDNDKRNLIQSVISQESQRDTSTFISHYLAFLSWSHEEYPIEHDFDDREQYVKTRLTAQYKTLSGEFVSSQDEKAIADFLYRNNIRYQHENHAEWAEVGEAKGKYEVDFYLPEYDIYIEHWGIDDAGAVAPWFDASSEEYDTATEAYHAKMRWARHQFQTHDKTLVETYHFEYHADRLERVLKARLTYHGVEFDRMDWESLVDETFEHNQGQRRVIKQFEQFISNANTFRLLPDEIEGNLSQDNPAQYHFGHCGVHLLRQYKQYLVEHDLIDFSDMIYEALETVQQNPDAIHSNYDHVLVDEFQDIGAGQRHLVDELVGPVESQSIDDVHLFAVGDDWQSIYSFQGSVVDYFTDFGQYFGTPTRTELLNNYRCPETVTQAGTELIAENPSQVEKSVRPASELDTDPQLHALHGTRWFDYVNLTRSRTLALCDYYLQEASAAPGEIMILCRYDNAAPILDYIKHEFRNHGIPYTGKDADYTPPAEEAHSAVDPDADDHVSIYSIHQSKGREAKHVILTHASSGPAGFPPEDRHNELLRPVRPITISSLAEERRLFYVAITRSAGTLDILTKQYNQSKFVEEIESYLVPAEDLHNDSLDEDAPTTVTVDVQVVHLFDEHHPDMYQKGRVNHAGSTFTIVLWNRHDPATLEEDQWYKLKEFRFREYEGEKQLQYTESSTIRLLLDPPAHIEGADIEKMS